MAVLSTDAAPRAAAALPELQELLRLIDQGRRDQCGGETKHTEDRHVENEDCQPAWKPLRYRQELLLLDQPDDRAEANREQPADVHHQQYRPHLISGPEEDDGEVVGFLAYRTDWFQCTFVSLIVVAENARRRGVARVLFREVERRSPSPRLFSSMEETNAVSIQMHRALGFAPSGHIDNLPQGYRELLFYKRLRP